VPARVGLLAILAGAVVAFLAFRGQPPFDNLAERLALPSPWGDLTHPLMLAAQVCFLAVLLLALLETVRLRLLRRRLTRPNKGRWAERFYQACAADLPPEHAPDDFKYSVARHCEALEQAVVWRWRVPFVLTLLVCQLGRVVGLRALKVNSQPRLAPADYFLPLWVASGEAALGVIVIYLGLRGPWSRLLAALESQGERLANASPTAPTETGRTPETRPAAGAAVSPPTEG
jgi:hypothetical protein